MSNAVRHATTIQVGKEATRGTLVNAARLVVANDATLSDLAEMHQFENQLAGVAVRTIRSPVQVGAGSELKVMHPLDFEQALLPFMGGMRGAVVGAVLDTSAYTWTFTPPVAADPLPDTWTVEVVEDDFANEDEFEFGYGIVTEIEVKGGADQVAEISYSMMGRAVKTGTKTPALTLPTDIHPAANMLWAVHVDGAWAGLGTTQIVGQVVDFTWKWSDYLFPRYTLDGRADLDFPQYGFKGDRVADLTMTVFVDTNNGFADAELVHKKAGTGRAIRLGLDTGVVIGGTTATRRMHINGFYHHLSDSLQDRLADKDGNLTVTMHLQSTYEPTAAQDAEVVFQNTLPTFP